MQKDIHNRISLIKNRKELRRNLTPAEATLWRILKSKALKTKFRRQHSVGNYILDFYCPEYKLGVELDGAHHFTEAGLAHDEKREAYLMQFGIKIIRVENVYVFERTDFVIELIEKNLKK